MAGSPPPGAERLVRLIFAVFAVASLLAGIFLYYFADRIGLPETEARLMATVFLAASVLDALVLCFWERIFRQKR